MNLADRGMGIGLRALNRFAGLRVVDRAGLRKPAERALYHAGRAGFATAGAAGRTFAAAQKLGSPKRLEPRKPSGLFDLTPSDEQQMLTEAVKDFAAKKLRPAAEKADAQTAAPAKLLAQSAELGLTMLGVPEELGGAVAERSAVTSVLVGEALAHGDMGLAVAALAPAAVGTALSLWGDADQQATYLHEFVGDDVPAAALAVIEPRALFDPLALQTRAKVADGGYTLTGVKSLVPLAGTAELFVVAAELAGRGPALFLVESKSKGITVEPEPAMGIRAAADRDAEAGRGQGADDRVARWGRAGGVLRVRRAGAACLVLAGRRDRAGRGRLRHPLRERAGRLRRADQPSPGGRVRDRRCRDRARGHAAGDLPRRRQSRLGQAVHRADGDRPARCARATGCRSAPPACSCSAVTATSRSTRSNAGTATCAPPA